MVANAAYMSWNWLDKVKDVMGMLGSVVHALSILIGIFLVLLNVFARNWIDAGGVLLLLTFMCLIRRMFYRQYTFRVVAARIVRCFRSNPAPHI